MAEYERHEPEKTLLHEVVREQLEGFLASASCRDQPVPHFIEQELRAFLRCGVLAHGFLRLRCDDCGHDRLVAFSCKRRGFCPSCGGRRMADTAAHLVDRVLPEVPIRQWVLTLSYPLRYHCAYDAKLTSEVLRAFLCALFAEIRRRTRRQWGVRAEQCGAVTFIQRFGSALNLNLHFHTLALDGVYTGGQGGTLRFLPLPPTDADEVARVLSGTARRLQRLIEARPGDGGATRAHEEALLAMLAAASLRSRVPTGAHRGERWRRLGDRVEPSQAGVSDDPDASARVPQHGGMSLHADVAVPARDRRRLERLCRYVARPPLACERLEARPDGTLTLRLKTPWRDGTTHILMERRELIERLVPLVPPPRAHQVRYHGILAPGASQRDRIVPGAGDPGPSEEPTEPDRAAAPQEPEAPRDQKRRMRWAALLQRVFEVDALRCPRCGSTLRIVGAIEDPWVAQKILACLELPARAPPLAPAAAEAADLDPGPVEDFDQSPLYEDP